MISFNNPFAPKGPALPASQVAAQGLKTMRTTNESEGQHAIADGFLKTVAKTGTPEEVAFAKTVRAASGKLTMQYQKAHIEGLALKVLAGGIQGSAGLALAHFGKEAYAFLREAPRGDNAKANAAAARIMQGIEENAHNSNAELIAELGQSVTKKADGPGRVVTQVFDSVIDSQANEKPETAIANYGWLAGTTGYFHDPERVTGPILDFLIANSSNPEVTQEAEMAKQGAKAGPLYRQSEVHKQAFQDIAERDKPVSFAELAHNPPGPKADESAYLFSQDAHGAARPEEYLMGYDPKTRAPVKSMDQRLFEADNPPTPKSLDQIMFERDAGIY